MTRIEGVSAREAGPYVKLAFHFTRRSLARLTGLEPEGIIEPLQMYAHVPGLLRGYARLEQATAKLHRVDKRLRALAELKAATLTHCEYCIDMGSQISRVWGLSDEKNCWRCLPMGPAPSSAILTSSCSTMRSA